MCNVCQIVFSFLSTDQLPATYWSIIKTDRKGNDTSLQYSCLENPRGGGAWWAAIYGVAQSRTQLK